MSISRAGCTCMRHSCVRALAATPRHLSARVISVSRSSVEKKACRSGEGTPTARSTASCSETVLRPSVSCSFAARLAIFVCSGLTASCHSRCAASSPSLAREASALHCMKERASARISRRARVSWPVRKARSKVPAGCSCHVPSGSSAWDGALVRATTVSAWSELANWTASKEGVDPPKLSAPELSSAIGTQPSEKRPCTARCTRAAVSAVTAMSKKSDACGSKSKR